jgi:membrane fusion protein, adhesin transport system
VKKYLEKAEAVALRELRGSFLYDLAGTRLVVVLVAAGFGVFLLWGALARIDEVAMGEGKVRPSSKAQLIQSAEPSTVREILVQSGQRVRKGQLLVRLDDTQSSSELGQLEAEKDSLAARAARLDQEADGVAFGCTPEMQKENPKACDAEVRLQQVRAQALASRNSELVAAVEQRRREVSEAQATVASLRTSLGLAQREVAMLEPMAAKGIVPETDLLSARRELSDLQGRLNAAQESISRSSAAVREAQAQLASANLQFRQEALDEMNQLQGKLSVIAQSSLGAAGKLERSELRSPVDGVVNDVQVTTIGGFVAPGQKIMEVVPVDEKLLVETRVQPKDIAFIRVGQAALVKVSAYDFSVYGGLPGKVVQVSADSIYDEATKQAFFTVIVETNRSYLSAGPKRLPITPGMICTADIMTGRKSVLDYLLKPVLKARDEALRER